MNRGKGIIIGGGIGGLTTAVALLQAGEDISLYEDAPELGEVGAGIWIAANAMQVFDLLGLAADVMARGEQIHAIEVKHYDMSTIVHSELAKMVKKFGFGITAIHRARLVEAIATHIPSERLNFNKRLSRVEEQGNKVIAHFEDGSSTEGDYLIGADGIRSKTRASIFPDANIRYSGQTCWRGVARMPLEILLGNQAAEIWGSQRRFGFSVIGKDEVYWFACLNAEQGSVDEGGHIKERLAEIFEAFAEPVQTIISHTSEVKIIRNDLEDLVRLSRWSSGRICLIGDAAHATTPNLGQGAGQAIEDAWCLACLFDTERPVATIFRDLHRLRRKKVDGIVQRSYNMGKIAHLRYGKRLRNLFLKSMPSALMEKQFEDLYYLPSKEDLLR